jgi:acetyltransferase-like isoleucine patch superfamily enzyme
VSWTQRAEYFLRRPLQLPIVFLTRLPYFRFVRGTLGYQNPITFETWFAQKILNLGNNRSAYWPVHPTSQVFDAENILAGVDTSPGMMKGCYIQGRGGITIGDYTQIGPGVGIISANHDPYDTRKHIAKPVVIGKYCWLGMGAKIMPGVTLGDFTIVGAGSVVTKSFPDGHCVIAGNPARIVRSLDADKCIRYEHPVKFFGYLDSKAFERMLHGRATTHERTFNAVR